MEQILNSAVFSCSTDQFEATGTESEHSDYRLDQGDYLVPMITGVSRQAYILKLTREGFVVIPEVGRP